MAEAVELLRDAGETAQGAGDAATAAAMAAEECMMTGHPEAAVSALEGALAQGGEGVRLKGLLSEARRRMADQQNSGEALELHLCAHVGRYRQLARSLPRPGDTVIELGAAEGHTTLLLSRRAQRVVAVDSAHDCIERAQARCRGCGNVAWIEGDAFETTEVVKETPTADLVFVDVGGSTWATIAMRLAATYRKVFRPRGIVIRNVALNDFSAAVTSCEAEAQPGAWRRPFG